MTRVETLLDLSALETELQSPEDRALHAEDVEIFLTVLREEATDAGIKAYEAKMADLPAEEYPWSAVRARHYWEPGAQWGRTEALIRRGPPALSLALARRTDLEPELASDELPAPGSGEWDSLWQSLFEWNTVLIRASMGPVGWVPPEDEIEAEIDPAEPLDGPEIETRPALPVPRPPGPGPQDTGEPVPAPAEESAVMPAEAENPWGRRALIGTGVVAGVGAAGALIYVVARGAARGGAA